MFASFGDYTEMKNPGGSKTDNLFAKQIQLI